MKKANFVVAFIIGIIFISCNGNSSSHFIGTWVQSPSKYSNCKIKITKSGESFLIEPAGPGDSFCGGWPTGIYTLTKEGNLSGMMGVTIGYDKSTNQLIIDTDHWKKVN